MRIWWLPRLIPTWPEARVVCSPQWSAPGGAVWAWGLMMGEARQAIWASPAAVRFRARTMKDGHHWDQVAPSRVGVVGAQERGCSAVRDILLLLICGGLGADDEVKGEEGLQGGVGGGGAVDTGVVGHSPGVRVRAGC